MFITDNHLHFATGKIESEVDFIKQASSITSAFSVDDDDFDDDDLDEDDDLEIDEIEIDEIEVEEIEEIDPVIEEIDLDEDLDLDDDEDDDDDL